MLKQIIKNLVSSNKKQNIQADAPLTSSEQVTVVSSFSADGFLQYGKSFIDSFLNYWPENFRVIIYAEGFSFDSNSPRVSVVDLHSEIPKLAEFKRRNLINPVVNGRIGSSYDYRFDAVRFANKSYVICDASKKCSTRFLVWLDGDTRSFLRLPKNFIAQVLRSGDFLAYLGRRGSHTETGFLPFDLHHPGAREFFSSLEGLYESGAIFSMREWHDCEAIDVCRAYMTAKDEISSRNLNIYGSSHPFINSIPGLFMDHMKGPRRKIIGSSATSDYVIPPPSIVNFGGRYSQIDKILDDVCPLSIVEVGTWSGWRAVQMSLVGLCRGLPVNYKGFDVFEDFSPEFDKVEKNVKTHFALREVERLLLIVRDLYPDFSFDLVPGNTRETLKSEIADFVFLDGGHSIETISSDYRAVKDSAVILFDDYYSGGIDVSAFGCNMVLDGLDHVLLPVKDPVSGGGFTQFALVGGRSSIARK